MYLENLDTCTWLRIRSSDGLYLGPMNDDGTVPLVTTEAAAGIYRLNADIASCMPLNRFSRYYITDRTSGRRVGAPSSPAKTCSLFGQEVNTPALFQLSGSGPTSRLVFYEKIVPWYATNCDTLLGITADSADSLNFRLERVEDDTIPTQTPKNNLWWIIFVSVLGGLLLIGILVSIGIYVHRQKQNREWQSAQKARGPVEGNQQWNFGGFGGYML